MGSSYGNEVTQQDLQTYENKMNSQYQDLLAKQNAFTSGSSNQDGSVRKVSANVQYDSSGRPIQNPYMSITNADGSLNSAYSEKAQDTGNVSLNTDALNKIQQNALSSGPTEYAQAQQQNLNQQQANASAQAAKQNAANTTNAQEQLAMKGGVSSGSRERLAAQGANNAATSQQNIANQGIQGSNQIAMNDAQLKNTMLNEAQTGQNQLAAFNQSQRAYSNQLAKDDINSAKNDVTGQNAYNSGAYNQALSAWGSQKTADAQAAASSSGGKK